MYQDLFISAFSILKDLVLFEILTTFDLAYFTSTVQSKFSRYLQSAKIQKAFIFFE